MASTPGQPMPYASVVLWAPGRRRIGWRRWSERIAIAVAIPVVVIGMARDLWLFAVPLAAGALGALVYRDYRRREWERVCEPSHVTVGDGYLELRTGSGADAGTSRWDLPALRSIRFKGAPLDVGGTVTISTDQGTISVPTGPPVNRTKSALKTVRRAARAQGFELGTRRASAGPAGAESGSDGSGDAE